MLLTIDIGTTSFKSALWSLPESPVKLDGADSSDTKDIRRLSFVSVPVSQETPPLLSSSLNEESNTEIDPALWLNAFTESCKQLLSETGIKNFSGVKAIVISGNGPSLVPVTGESFFANKFEAPALKARLWLDHRAVKYQEKISAVMGGFVNAGFFLPKIYYLKNDENEIYTKTKYFLGCPEYLAFALTGNAKTVFPCDGFDRWFWNDSALDQLDLDASKFPEFIRPGDLFGTLMPSAAQYFGFPKDTPVISGGPDFYAAILGSGVTEAGQICDRSGSSEGVNLCTTRRVVNEERLMSYAHPIKPFWNLSGIINTTGAAIEWGRNLLGLRSFNDFITLSKISKPGSKGVIFIPYLAGERAPLWDPLARASWQGISLGAGRGEIVNAILESIGFAVRDVIGVMEQSGESASQLRVTGGLADCGRLNQIKADITGKQVLCGVHKDEELLGLAIIGACYLKIYSSYEQASKAMCRIEKTWEPDLNNKKIYDDLFYQYLYYRSRKKEEK